MGQQWYRHKHVRIHTFVFVLFISWDHVQTAITCKKNEKLYRHLPWPWPIPRVINFLSVQFQYTIVLLTWPSFCIVLYALKRGQNIFKHAGTHVAETSLELWPVLPACKLPLICFHRTQIQFFSSTRISAKRVPACWACWTLPSEIHAVSGA